MNHKRSKPLLVYLSVISSIEKYYKLPSLKSLGLTKQALYKYTRRLKHDGIINNMGYGTWELNKDKAYTKKYILELQQVNLMHPCRYQCTPPLDKRGHGFIMKIGIPKLKNWEKRTEYLNKNDIEYLVIPQGQRLLIKGFKVWLTETSIVIYTPKGRGYFTQSAEEARKLAIYDLLAILKHTEQLLRASFRVQGGYNFSISRQHYGKINDTLAAHYNDNNKKLEVRDLKGRWLLIDDSYNLDELETVHNETAVKDMDKIVVPWFNSLKEHYEATGESPKVTDIITATANITKITAHHTAQIGKIITKLENI